MVNMLSGWTPYDWNASCQKVSSSRTCVQPCVLSSTPSAVQYHSQFVDHQVDQSCGVNLSVDDWGGISVLGERFLCISTWNPHLVYISWKQSTLTASMTINMMQLQEIWYWIFSSKWGIQRPVLLIYDFTRHPNGTHIMCCALIC